MTRSSAANQERPAPTRDPPTRKPGPRGISPRQPRPKARSKRAQRAHRARRSVFTRPTTRDSKRARNHRQGGGQRPQNLFQVNGNAQRRAAHRCELPTHTNGQQTAKPIDVNSDRAAPSDARPNLCEAEAKSRLSCHRLGGHGSPEGAEAKWFEASLTDGLPVGQPTTNRVRACGDG